MHVKCVELATICEWTNTTVIEKSSLTTPWHARGFAATSRRATSAARGLLRPPEIRLHLLDGARIIPVLCVLVAAVGPRAAMQLRPHRLPRMPRLASAAALPNVSCQYARPAYPMRGH